MDFDDDTDPPEASFPEEIARLSRLRAYQGGATKGPKGARGREKVALTLRVRLARLTEELQGDAPENE